MSVTVITPPAPLVSLALAKQHLVVEAGDQDTLIEAYIAAASAHIDGPEGWLGRAIGQQTLEWSPDCFPACRFLKLPYEPVQSITSVNYLDGAGVAQLWAAENYQLSRGRLIPAFNGSWPSARVYPGAITVRWVAGYETIPAPIEAAALLMVGDLFAFRETAGANAAAVAMSATVQNLLAPYRARRV